MEKVFAEGIIFKRNENAPDFVVGAMSVKVEEAVPFLQANAKNGWTNLQIKQSQGGKYYVELDTFEPKSKTSEPTPEPAPAKGQADLPF